MSFFNVQPNDRLIVDGYPPMNGKTGVCQRTVGMLVYVLFDGETEEKSINAFYISPEADRERTMKQSDAADLAWLIRKEAAYTFNLACVLEEATLEEREVIRRVFEKARDEGIRFRESKG